MLKYNPALETLPVYQPGRPIEAIAREYGFAPEEIVKLASNENPLGPSPLALEALRDTAARAHRYPDGNGRKLKERLAQELNLSPANLILGNGSNDLIELVGHAVLRPGASAVVSQYGFAIFTIVVKLFEAEVIAAPATNFGSDPEAIVPAVKPSTTALFVAEPNNPTGTRAGAPAVEDLIDRVPARVLTVIDEAYLEYLDEPQDLVPHLRRNNRPNLLLLRTFSKIHGLAGLRLGYGIGPESLIGQLEKIRQPFNANLMAQAAALAALEDPDHVAKSRRHNRIERQRFEQECRERNWTYVPSHANFVLLRTGDGQAAFQTLLRHGIIVRPMSGYGLPEWVRISIGLADENRRCLQALERWFEARP